MALKSLILHDSFLFHIRFCYFFFLPTEKLMEQYNENSHYAFPCRYSFCIVLHICFILLLIDQLIGH